MLLLARYARSGAIICLSTVCYRAVQYANHIQSCSLYQLANNIQISSYVRAGTHHAECQCLSLYVLAVLRLFTSGIAISMSRTKGCDLSINLALGMHESLRRFQLPSIKGLNS